MDRADATTIGRARVTGWPDRANALAARLAVAHALASVDLLPSGLPPAAVLIVRRLPAPDGGRPALRQRSRVDPVWERAARSALADLAGRAARPWDGSAPPDCPAVLFRDEAELLACLALDVALGLAGERWWWQALPGRRRWGSLARSALPAVLLDQPALLPAVLRLLHGRSQVPAIVERLAPGEAGQALQAMCAAFGIEPFGPAVQSWRAAPDPGPGAAATSSSEAPWLPWLPAGSVPATWAPESVCLLGVALSLTQAPALAQRPAFRGAVEQWWQAQRMAFWREGPRPASNPAALPLAVFRVEAAVAPADVAASEAAPPARADVTPPARADVTPSALAAAPDDRPRAEGPHRPDPGRLLPAASAADEGWPGRVQPDLASATVQPDEAHTVDASAQEGVATELAGVLFLINVMQQLDLPGCFEPDWQLARSVGSWGLLELLGRALLLANEKLAPSDDVATFAALAADPLWAALAALDGREPGEIPGARFTGPHQVTIPADWSRWLDPGATARLAQPIELDTTPPLDGPLLAGVSRDLRRWLAVVTPLLRQMLARRLGGQDDGASILLLRRGRLYVTSSHVDLVLPLDSVALPVRIAGLDFDPGWQPAFGRVVKFHYR